MTRPNDAGAATNAYTNAAPTVTDDTRTANPHGGQPATSTTPTPTARSSPNAHHALPSPAPDEVTGYVANAEHDATAQEPTSSPRVPAGRNRGNRVTYQGTLIALR